MLSAKGKSDHTAKAYGSDLRGLLDHFGVDSIPHDEFDDRASEYLTAFRRTVSPNTTGRRLTALRAYAKWARIDALSDYSAPTAPRAYPHPIPEGPDGILRLIDATDNPRHKGLVALCGLAGLRVSEANAVRLTDLDYTNKTVKVWGKGDKERVVPMGDRGWAILLLAVGDAALNGRQEVVGLADRTAREALTKLGAKAGLARSISSHDLRATYGTAAYNKTKNLRAVQELLGHSNSKTTELYTGVELEQMREAGDFI